MILGVAMVAEALKVAMIKWRLTLQCDNPTAHGVES